MTNNIGRVKGRTSGAYVQLSKVFFIRIQWYYIAFVDQHITWASALAPDVLTAFACLPENKRQAAKTSLALTPPSRLLWLYPSLSLSLFLSIFLPPFISYRRKRTWWHEKQGEIVVHILQCIGSLETSR